MKKHLGLFGILLAGLFWLGGGFTVAAGAMTDECSTVTGIGNYTNFFVSGQDITGWGDPPDSTYLSQKDNRKQASAVYQVSGAEEVTVAIYSRYGSFASLDGDEMVRGGEGEQYSLEYSTRTQEVYCCGRRMCYDANTGSFVFLEEEIPRGLTEYGLSVYCSRDGDSYTKTSCSLVRVEAQAGAYFYESYTASLDPGTRYVKLVLTDQSSIQILGREERYEFVQKGGLSLASVEFEGEAAPEPPSNSPEDPPALPEPPESVPESSHLPIPGVDIPAFEEELPESSSKASSSSSSGGKEASSKATKPSKNTTQKPKSSGSQQQTPEDDKMISAKQPLPQKGEHQELQRRPDNRTLWEKLTTPDAVTVILFSITLLVVGIRLLAGRSR